MTVSHRLQTPSGPRRTGTNAGSTRGEAPSPYREAGGAPPDGACTARDTPPADRPRERLHRRGAAALRDCELLAAVLGTGYRGRHVSEVARRILDEHPMEQLVSMSLSELESLKGLGRAKAGVLVAAFELARRGLNKGLGLLPVIQCPADAMPLLTDVKDQRREHFLCLYLNARNQVIHRETISVGSLSASIVHPREVFYPGIQEAAASIVLAHNHPSGDVTPSREDLDLTRRLVKAGQIMGMEVLDHIIIGPEEYLSLKERGLM